VSLFPRKSFTVQSLLIQAIGVFVIAAGYLLALAPSAPFSKELGVCESGAVRDVVGGHIILPRFLPGPIVHVPPLYWWVTAVCVKALGWDELAFRLPSLVAAALTCTIVFAWSSKSLGPSVGWWSAAALLLCHFFLDAARQPRMDSMLALFVTAAVVSLERAITIPAQGRHQTSYFVVAACAIGLGVLTKGILGIVLPAVVIGLFLLIRGGISDLFRIDLLATFIAGLSVGVAWFIAGYHFGGHKFLEWQLQMNLWSRFVPASAGGAEYCAHPFWYFAPHVVTGFLPWSLYLPAFVLAVWPSAGRRLHEPITYAICWFAAMFIFFSSSHGKCLIYILPAFPPLAILVGWTIVQAQEGLSARTWVSRLFATGSIGIVIGILVVVVAAMTVIGYGIAPKLRPRLHPTDRRFLELLVRQGYNWRLLIWAGFSIMSSVVILGGCARRAPKLQAAGTVLIAAIGGWFWFGVMNPALARAETLKSFARQVAGLVPADHVRHFGLGDCELNFYSPQPLDPISQVSCTEQAAPAQYVIIRKQDFDAIPILRRSCFTVESEATPNDSIGPRLLIRRTGRGR
jgi:Dolichyl-phosphate-mannose-protein mannosyltransferase